MDAETRYERGPTQREPDRLRHGYACRNPLQTCLFADDPPANNGGR